MLREVRELCSGLQSDMRALAGAVAAASARIDGLQQDLRDALGEEADIHKVNFI